MQIEKKKNLKLSKMVKNFENLEEKKFKKS